MRCFPAPEVPLAPWRGDRGEALGIGVGSVISRKKIEGHGRYCVRSKTLTPPLPLPYRGGESIVKGKIVYNYLILKHTSIIPQAYL